MRLQKNTVITLSDRNKYMVVDIIEFRGVEYAYLLSMYKDMPYFAFCTERIEGEKHILTSIKDKYLTKRLAALFSNHLIKASVS